MKCSNCGSPEGRHVSYDLDLPTLCLCGVCSLLLVSDLELFDSLGARHRRTGQPVLPALRRSPPPSPPGG